MKLGFSECVLDLDTRELHRAGVRVELTPKGYELLELLVRERPRAVSKAEIRDRLWPKTAVADVTLTTLAFGVRKAIGDDASKPRHLRTVRTYGYAFAGEVAEVGRPSPAQVVCRLLLGDREFPLAEGEHVLGRGSEADVVLDLPKVSRRHARICVQAGGSVLEDLGSKNGTFLRGKKLTAPVSLEDGDEIRVGSARMTYRRSDAADSTATDTPESPWR